ncbi:MAG TPA: hypothetical protein VFS67_08045 [Polyangiaceae bacterium]|nr:hypothetical protein [Polyangiaceae bacterium]
MTPDDDLLADVEFDLIDESDPPPEESEDVFARDTAIPAAPPEQIAAEAMLQTESDPARPPMDTVDDHAPTPPPARPRLTPATLEPPASEDLEFDSFDTPIDVFGDPLPGTAAAKPNFGQSEVPTAPPIGNKKSPRPHAQPSPQRHPVADKLTQPVNQRGRPAFLAETARNRPPSPEILARATPQNARGGQQPRLDPEFDLGSDPPISDSALDFVDQLPPVAPSVKPVTGREKAAPPPVSARAGVRELEECYAVGDYSRALQIAEQMLARSPDDLAARRYAQNCRDVLTQMFAARIGPLDQVISVVVSPEEVQWLSLDHRAGFLLSLVDGMSTVDEILDISGMTRLDALKILHDLAEQQVVKLA